MTTEPGDAASSGQSKLVTHGLAPWALIGIGLCVAGVVGIGLRPPYELLDGSFRRIGTERKFVLSAVPKSRGIWRLDLGRLCIEEGVLLACAAGLSVVGRRRKA